MLCVTWPLHTQRDLYPAPSLSGFSIVSALVARAFEVREYDFVTEALKCGGFLKSTIVLKNRQRFYFFIWLCTISKRQG